MSARANPKSSTGRLDIFTRVITDNSYRFDDVVEGYHGGLWLEVVSRSFTIKVQTGLSLNQIRLLRGGGTRLGDEHLGEVHSNSPLLFNGRKPVAAKDLPLGGGLFLSLALSEADGPQVGWRAKKNSALLDLSQIAGHEANDFWEPVRPERGGGVILEPEEFYLLLSREAVRVPPGLACEMTAYDPTSGELRTHYAGFFDPGFGHRRRSPGSRAALEVRAHDVPFMVEDGQRICKLVFERMAEVPDALYGEGASHYQFQQQTLSKHFRLRSPADEAPVSGPATAPGDQEALFG
jgi:dCTP deaminase